MTTRLISFACVVLMLVCGMVHAKSCSDFSIDEATQRKASDAVLALPEVRAWIKSHHFPVTTVPDLNSTESTSTDLCAIAVTVYADRTDRLELWQIFFTNLSGTHVIGVSDPATGEMISLSQWRHQQSRR